MTELRIMKFGTISEGADGRLVFKDFHIDCGGQTISPHDALLRAVIERLQFALQEPIHLA